MEILKLLGAGMLCVWLGLGNNSEGWRKEVEKNGVHWADRGWLPFLRLRGVSWLVRYGCVYLKSYIARVGDDDVWPAVLTGQPPTSTSYTK